MSDLHSLSSMITRPIFFVTTDCNLAVGLVDLLPNYHIVTRTLHPLIHVLRAAGKKVFCLEESSPTHLSAHNAGSLLRHPLVTEYITSHSPSQQSIILVFKNSPQIEKWCQIQGYVLASNSVALTQPLEDKITFSQTFSQIEGVPLLPFKIASASKFQPESFPCVIQTAHGWAGKSTHIIHDQLQFNKIKSDLKDQTIKYTPYISGRTYTINACIYQDQIYHSQPALQINPPHPEFSSNPAATCGRQWPAINLNPHMVSGIIHTTDVIGTYLRNQGYQGHFGVDFLVTQDQHYVLEINPRFTASESWSSQLDILYDHIPLSLIHLMSFLNFTDALTLNSKPISGTQLIMRNNLDHVVTVREAIPCGSFSFHDGQLHFDSSQYHLTSLSTPQIIIKCPRIGSEISPGNEILRVETNYSLISDTGILPQDFTQALINLKHQLLAS